MKIMRKNSGFTMIELFITMALMGILAATAIPQLMVIIPNYELRSVARDMFSHFQLAKLTAAKRNADCAISFTRSGEYCTGYTVYMDLNKNKVYDADNEEIIASVDWSEKRAKGVWCKDDEDNDAVNFRLNDKEEPTVAFRSIGIPTWSGGGFAAGTVHFSNKNGLKTNVVLSRAGNVRIGKSDTTED